MQGATDAKVAIEEAEREARSQRGGDDDHKPRFFELRGDDYRPLFKCVRLSVAPADRIGGPRRSTAAPRRA